MASFVALSVRKRRKSIKLSNQYPLLPQVRHQGAIYCAVPCKYPATSFAVAWTLCRLSSLSTRIQLQDGVSSPRFSPTFPASPFSAHTHTHTDFSGLCASVLHGNFMKSFHTISYVRASTQQVFIASACLKVPSQKARNSKLFFHCYQLPATQ